MVKPPLIFDPYQIGEEIGYKLLTRCPQSNSSLTWDDYLFNLGRVAHTASGGVWTATTHKGNQSEICPSFEDAIDFVTLIGLEEWLKDRASEQQITQNEAQKMELMHQRTWLELFAQALLNAQRLSEEE